jgi:hypothetical protein
VHKLGFLEFRCTKVYVFRGSKELTKEQVLNQLGLLSGPGGGFQQGALGHQSAGVGPGQEQRYIPSQCLVPRAHVMSIIACRVCVEQCSF